MKVKAQFVEILPNSTSCNSESGFTPAKRYEVLAIDPQNKQLYVYNDFRSMVTVDEHACIVIPKQQRHNN